MISMHEDPLIHEGPLAHKDAKFINVLYYKPLGALLGMDKDHLRHALARANLVCHWLEGILELIAELESDREGE